MRIIGRYSRAQRRPALGVTLSMYPVANERAMQAALASGRADIAAVQLTARALRLERDRSRVA